MAESDGANKVLWQNADGDSRAKDKRQLPPAAAPATPRREFGGPKGPEPTRYGDWERNGRCSDF